jgi:hypothetical protein
MKRIIYPNGTTISVIIPAPSYSGTIEELAQKDVPEGTPFLIVDAIEIPVDRSARMLWGADFSTPDGYGGA